jgi:hypothetical protein
VNRECCHLYKHPSSIHISFNFWVAIATECGAGKLLWGASCFVLAHLTFSDISESECGTPINLDVQFIDLYKWRFTAWSDNALSVALPVLLFANFLNKKFTGIMTTLHLFLLLCSFVTCFQIITAFVSYRHESFPYNTFCFVFISPGFEARKFCLNFALKFALSLSHVIGKKKKTKMCTYSSSSAKYKHWFADKYKIAHILKNLQYVGTNSR